MADIIATGTSEYSIGGIDTATPLVNGVSPRDAKHPNGIAAAVLQVEGVLGPGTTLRGTLPTLAARLAVLANNLGQLLLTGFGGLTTDRGLLAVSATQMKVANHTPVGVVQPYAGVAAPADWQLCDGTALSRTTQAKLFSIIGTQYGVGDGSTTYNVPDLRGRTVVMVDGTANRITSASTNGANADNLGGVGGTEIHTITQAQLPVIQLTLPSTNGDGVSATKAPTTLFPGSLDDTLANSALTSVLGSGAPHSNTQPWIALNYIIFLGVS